MTSAVPCSHLDFWQVRRPAAEVVHSIARSIEPGEDWSWCFLDEVVFVLDPQ